MVKKKDTRSLVPGEVIANPVVDNKGNVLVNAGVEVTPALVRVLEKRGVEDVAVHEDAAEAKRETAKISSAAANPVVQARLTEMHERLNLGFQHHVGNPTMAVLYKSVLDYQTAKIYARKGT